MHGSLSKMKAELADAVSYRLPVGSEELPLNQFLGKTLKLEFTGKITCQNCNSETKKSFSQGHCYPCMMKLASCDMCMMKPETCHFDKGTCREPEWAQGVCFAPHYVYLSNTSGLKVGITRHTQIPTRWIDQGATQALQIYKVSTRQQSGFVEMAFKDLIADKTNWRAILKGNAMPRNLLADASALGRQLDEQIENLITEFGENQSGDKQIERLNNQPIEINYPVLEFPTKIVSHNFDKKPIVEGTLMGIKGQYLIFDTGVINIRKFTSYEVSVN
jgi:hypothetical protein